MTENLDLFGDPIPANLGRRGRPPHIATQENRRKVSMLLACGWNNERIAAALRCDLKTLRKHYFPELRFREVARDRLDATRLMMVWSAAEAGNVGAMRLFSRAGFFSGGEAFEFKLLNQVIQEVPCHRHFLQHAVAPSPIIFPFVSRRA